MMAWRLPAALSCLTRKASAGGTEFISETEPAVVGIRAVLTLSLTKTGVHASGQRQGVGIEGANGIAARAAAIERGDAIQIELREPGAGDGARAERGV